MEVINSKNNDIKKLEEIQEVKHLLLENQINFIPNFIPKE